MNINYSILRVFTSSTALPVTRTPRKLYLRESPVRRQPRWSAIAYILFSNLKYYGTSKYNQRILVTRLSWQPVTYLFCFHKKCCTFMLDFCANDQHWRICSTFIIISCIVTHLSNNTILKNLLFVIEYNNTIHIQFNNNIA